MKDLPLGGSTTCRRESLLKIVGFLSPGVLRYVCVRDVMYVAFSVCIVRRGAVDVCVYEM